jgi:hypothetical protein
MNKIKKSSLIVAVLALFFSCNICLAEEARPRCLKAVEMLTGFGRAKLHGKGNYYLAPFIFDFDFDLVPTVEKWGLKLPGLFQFQLEPFISAVYRPDANVEIGNAFMLKLGVLPETFKFQPYIKAGVGMLYMTQHTREQSTQFNFLEQGAVGAHYFFSKKIALTMDCRFRHVSNASIKHPNHGINTLYYLLGATYEF